MPSLSLSHSVDADEIAFAISGMDDEEIRRFARQLAVALNDQSEVHLVTFGDAFASERETLEA